MTSTTFTGSAPSFLLSSAAKDINWGEHLKTKWHFFAALGAGCLVGASGLLLVQRVSRRVEHFGSSTPTAGSGETLSKELTSLHVTIKDLQDAVRDLKESRHGKNKPLKYDDSDKVYF